MKRTIGIATIFIALIFSVNAYADDKFVDAVKNAPLHQGSKPTGTQFEKAFDNPSWKYSENNGIKTVVFTGTVKKGSIFPEDEQSSYFDMQYSTIEESQFSGSVESLFSKYLKNEPKELQQRSGYFDKKLLSSEKNYNILTILEEKGTNSPIKAVLTLSKDGKVAELATYDAPRLYTHNEDARIFVQFVNFAK